MEKLTVAQVIKTFPDYTENEGWKLYSQKPVLDSP